MDLESQQLITNALKTGGWRIAGWEPGRIPGAAAMWLVCAARRQCVFLTFLQLREGGEEFWAIQASRERLLGTDASRKEPLLILQGEWQKALPDFVDQLPQVASA